MIQDQLISSLNDEDIVSDSLGDVKVDRTLAEVVEYVARKEQAIGECGTVSVEQAASEVKHTPHSPSNHVDTVKTCLTVQTHPKCAESPAQLEPCL